MSDARAGTWRVYERCAISFRLPRRRFLIRLLAAATLLVAASVGVAQTQDAQHTAKELEAKHQLERVRAEIHSISESVKATSGKKSEADAALREQELKVSTAAKELRTLDERLAGQQTKLDALEADRTALNGKLKVQRDALAGILRSAYATGRDQQLRLLLAQEDIGKIARLLAYYRYFEGARIVQIHALLGDLEQLATVQRAIDEESARIAVSRDQRQKDAQQLSAERDLRRQALSALDASLKDEQGRLLALGKDEKGLVQLLDRLRDIFADIPKEIAGAEPFEQLRGRLNWPLRGKISHPAAGEEGESHGVLIGSAEGAEVRAVSHGRVVFADWLRGFGLLLIIDHGDGYLSLYGYNETLLKDVGDWVNGNDAVATSGASGGRKQPGVYFELRHAGKPMEVEAWLKPGSRQP